MSEYNHTPGPWKISHGCLPGDRGFSVCSNNAKAERVKMVAECWPPLVLDEDHAEELFANARLIAAAPDLLGLAVWLRDADNANHLLSYDEREMVDAIIKKALGNLLAEGE